MEDQLYKFLLAGGSPTLVIGFLAYQSLKCAKEVNKKIDNINTSLQELIPQGKIMQNEIHLIKDRIERIERRLDDNV